MMHSMMIADRYNFADKVIYLPMANTLMALTDPAHTALSVMKEFIYLSFHF